MLVQRANGTLVPRSVRRTTAYVGTVDHRRGWVAVAHRGRDGVLRGQLRQALPPEYAALDLVDSARTGYPRRLRPARNDHDANGDRVQLLGVARRTQLGAEGLTMSGGRVSFTPPVVVASDTLDWFTYVVTDGTERRATGVVLVRVDP